MLKRPRRSDFDNIQTKKAKMIKERKKKTNRGPSDHFSHSTANDNCSSKDKQQSSAIPYDERTVMTAEDETKTLREWTVQFAEYFYPHAGTRTYRVPAVYFNHQHLLTPEQAAKRHLLLPAPGVSSSPSPTSPSSTSSSTASSSASFPQQSELSSASSEVKTVGCCSDDVREPKDLSAHEPQSNTTGCSRCRHRHELCGNQRQQRRQQQKPLHILFQPQESNQRRDRAMSIVLEALDKRGQALEGAGEKGLFIISGINYDHYLSRIPFKLRRAWAAGVEGERGAGGSTTAAAGYLGETLNSRGILDILAVQEKAGVILFQVKAVGGNTGQWSASEEKLIPVLRVVVQKVQFRSDHLKQELSRELLCTGSNSGVTHVLALPFISRQLYTKTMQDTKENVGEVSSELHVLCQEDFDVTTGHPGERPSPDDVLGTWWLQRFGGCGAKLSCEQVKVIAGRICGPFSSVTLLPDTKCRTEVRTYSHCVSETAARYSEPVLTVHEHDLLKCQDKMMGLCGPPGTGMTLLLALKAAHWLQKEPDRHPLTREQELGPAGIVEHHVIIASVTNTTFQNLNSTTSSKHVRRPGDAVLMSTIRNLIWDSRDPPELDGKRHLHDLVFDLSNVTPDNVPEAVDETLAAFIRDIRNVQVDIHCRGQTCSREALERDISAKDLEYGGVFVTPLTDCASKNTISEADAFSGTDVNIDEYVDQSTIQLSVIMTDIDDPSDLKFLRLLRALAQSQLVKFVWWSTTESLQDQTFLPEIARLEELYHVTRRPPHVQRVLKHLDWREGRKRLYTVDGLDSGLATDGVPVLCIRHRDHSTVPTIPAHNCLENPQKRKPTISWHYQTSSDEEKDVDIGHSRRSCLVGQIPSDNHNDQSRETDSSGHGKDIKKPSKLCSSKQKADDATDGSLQEKSVDDEFNRPQSSFNQNGGLQTTDRFLGHFCTSPFWCGLYTQSVSSLIEFFVTDSVNPRVSPFLVGTTKLLKDPSKNRFGIPIKPRDILIVTSLPTDTCTANLRHFGSGPDDLDQNRDTNDVCEINDSSEKQRALDVKSIALGEKPERRWKAIMESPLVAGIRKQIPLKVLTRGSAGKITFPRNYAVLTDVYNARCLERKVVIYIPWTSCGDGRFEQQSSVPAYYEQGEDSGMDLHKVIRSRNISPKASFRPDQQQQVLLIDSSLKTPGSDLASIDVTSDDNSDLSWDNLDVCDMSTDSDENDHETSLEDIQFHSSSGQSQISFEKQKEAGPSNGDNGTRRDINTVCSENGVSKLQLATQTRKQAHPTDIFGIDILVLGRAASKIKGKAIVSLGKDTVGCDLASTIDFHEDDDDNDDNGAVDALDANESHDDLLSLCPADRRGVFAAASCCLSQLVILL